jgi:hypothetical protein
MELDDIALFGTNFEQSWLASMVLPAGDVAKKYKVPVFDPKTARWVNIHLNRTMRHQRGDHNP